MIAYCWQSGLIGFGSRPPKGTLRIASGPAKPLREFITSRARHGYDMKKVKGRLTKVAGTDCLLVPGIPEAEVTGKDRRESLISFNKWLAQSPPKGITVFSAT
jgi:hypothetical protein